MSKNKGDDDDVEISIAEAELAKLQRQYRAAEGDRKAYNDEAQSTLRKQKATLEKLKQDNDHLKSEFTVAESSISNAQQSERNMRQLQAKLEGYKAEIDAEKELISDLDKQLASAESTVRSKTKAISKGRESSQAALGKQIATVENRLEKTLRDFNTTLTQNAAMRESIDHLKSERRVFDGLYKKLERELEDLKRQMADIIDKSNQAHESRDEAYNKIAAVKEKADREIAQYNMDIKEAMRVMEHDRKLKNFMGVKGQDRGVKDLSMTKRKAADKELRPEDQVKAYEEAFTKLKQSTGIEDTGRLVSRFIEVEDQNFALFNFVNELSNEIETLQEKIADIHTKSDLAKSNNDLLDEQRQEKLKQLEAKLTTTQQLAETFKARQVSTSSELASIKVLVDSLFTKIDCDRTAIADKLGNASITESNMLQFLGVIEKRANELLYLKTLLDMKAHDDWVSKESQLRDQALDQEDRNFDPVATLGPRPKIGGLLGTGTSKPTQAAATDAQIVPPSTGDDEDSDDEGGEVLSPEELKAKIIKGLNKPRADTSERKERESTLSRSTSKRNVR